MTPSPKKVCKRCGRNMLLRTGSRGKFWGCTGYPSCKYTENYQADGELRIAFFAFNKSIVNELKAKVARGLNFTGFKPSAYQQAIADFVLKGKGNAFVGAVAGSGKSTTALWQLSLLGGTPNISTLHSHGFQCLLKNFPQEPIVDEFKKDGIAKELLPDDEDNGIDNKYARSILVNLTSLVQNTLTDEDDVSAIYELIEHFGVETNSCEEQVLELLPEMVKRCADRVSVIDFDDMIWMPVRLNLPITQYDWVFIDECLPGYMPVLLADGTSLTIKEIVDRKLDVQVLAYDEKTGEQKACRIINWHKIPNNKPLVKVTVRWDEPTTAVAYSRNKNFVVCTTDHKIWTVDGWVEAGKLVPGVKVQVESSAAKTQRGKITAKGSAVVAKGVTERNNAGLMLKNPTKGWRSPRGGNGRPLSIPQQTLLDALGDGWVAEYGIKTKSVGGLVAGYPWAYKADIANLEHKIVIEVDGNNHSKIRDAKKDTCLQQLGWKVYRFTNLYVMQNLYDIVEIINEELADCPVSATVESVEPAVLQEYFVYDITVENCHNFYANGILVHNCQDMNMCQIEMLRRTLAKNGRIVGLGDKNQSIYGFRGADAEAVSKFIEIFDAITLPLSITYRCPASHVRLLQMIVPTIEAAPNAPEGELIYDMPLYKATAEMKSGDMVLCRVNAPLVKVCYSLIRSGKKAVIRGRDIGKGLISLVDKMRAASIVELVQKLEDYRRRELDKLFAKGARESSIMALNDRIDTLEALTDNCRDLTELRARIETIFSDKEEGTVCSSIHKAKGLEADNVYIIEPQLMPFPKATKAWEIDQEWHCAYVGGSRARRKMVWVDGKPSWLDKGVEQQVRELLGEEQEIIS